MTRVAVVGAGSIGARHAAHAAAHPRVQLAAVVDPDPARREGHGAPGFATIADVDVTIDAAIVAAPTDAHARLGAEAAGRGWAVLVEKPVAGTRADAEALIASCRAAGVPLLVGHHRRHHAVVRRLREMLRGGAIGRFVGVSALWCVKKPAGYFDVPWRAGADGSPVFINLVHDIDLLRFMAGEIAAIRPVLSDAARGGATEDSGALALRFEDGAVGTILFSDTAPSPWSFEAATGENVEIAGTGEDVYRFVGTKGALAFPSLTLWRGARDWSERPARTAEAVPPIVPLDAQLDHLADVVAGRAAPICDGEDAARTLDLALAVANEGRTP